jgi:hypothetical protein
MDCPICKQEMKKITQDVSHNPRDNKEYERIVYQCATDDAWLTTEIPREG